MDKVEKFKKLLDQHRVYSIEAYNGIDFEDYIKKEEIEKELLKMFEEEVYKNEQKANPYNSRTNQHKCYKDDKKKLDKLFKQVRKAYYSDVDKLTINFVEAREDLEDIKKGYCDEL